MPLEVHLAFEQPVPLEGDERLADPGGALCQGVRDVTSQTLTRFGSHFAALSGDVLDDAAAQRSGPAGLGRTPGTMGFVAHTPGLPITPSGVTRERDEPALPHATCGFHHWEKMARQAVGQLELRCVR